MHRVAVAICVAILLLCGIERVLAQSAPRRVALVIGNADYQGARLANPRNDARLVARSLQAAGFTIVSGGAQLDLDMDGMRDAMRAFGRMLGADTVAVFYYSGHGIEYRGENFLVPIDANLTNVTSAANVELDLVNVSLLLRQIEAANNGMAIVILDACRTSPFAKGLKDIGAGGLAQMQAPRGTLVAFATQPGHSATDGTNGNSPYALALAEEIGKPGVDVFNTFNEIARRVDDTTRHQQTPWFSSSPIAGQFFFTPQAASAPVLPPTLELAALPAPSTTPALTQAPVQKAPDEVAAPTPPAAAIPPPSPSEARDLARRLQTELRRVGCFRSDLDGIWGQSSAAALERFNKIEKTNLDARLPTSEALAMVAGRTGTICLPLITRAQPVPAPKSETPAQAPARQRLNCIHVGTNDYCE